MQRFKENLKSFNIRDQEGKIILFFGMAILIYISFVLYADIKKIAQLAFTFHWQIIPLLIILTLLNYFVRAVRFYLYLKRIHIDISFIQAVIIFFSGMSMTVTPGKTGEIIKAYLVKKTSGNGLSELIPLLVVERLTDGIAMIILAIAGLFIIKSSVIFFILATLFVLFFIILIKAQNLIMKLIIAMERKFPKLKMLDFFLIFFHNSQKLLTLKSLALGIVLGMIAWAFEGISLFILIKEFVKPELFSGISISLFIFSFSSIAGFFVFIPGGIGVAEGSITYFLTQLFALQVPVAVFITILFRFVTLWLGVSLGLVFLLTYLRSFSKREDYFL